MSTQPRCYFNILLAAEKNAALKNALHQSIAMAEQLQVDLHILRVLSNGRSGAEEEDRDTLVRMAKEELAALAPADKVLDLPIHWEVREGEPAEQIVNYARDAGVDLILLGTHRRRVISRFLFGSVADEVHRRAPCPVVMVPADEQQTNGELARRGVEILEAEYGESLGAGESSREQLTSSLARGLCVPDEVASQVLDRLQAESGDRGLDAETLDHFKEHEDRYDQSDARSAVAQDDGSFGSWQEPQAEEGITQSEPEAPAYDLLRRAVKLDATDIHIDPRNPDEFSVRFRIDGRLEHYCSLDRDIGEHLMQRYKTLADLDITDPFEPQEGYLQLPGRREDVQIRITTAPVEGGETVCLRIHRVDRMCRPLNALGLSTRAVELAMEMLERGEGLVVVAGPTGGGKTTTIYSMLQQLRRKGHHALIASIEDPVELRVPFLRQMSVDDARGMTLNRGLRTILRLDPDVIFVGEIRDEDTAEIAMRAASSGRTVFTTFHSREVAATITAFDDLGAKRYSLSANLTGIVSQQLIRRLCAECRQPKPIEPSEKAIFEQHDLTPPERLWHARGCDVCRGKGYRGRTGVFEAMVANDTIREAIEQGASEPELRQLIRSNGTPSLTTEALNKVEQGISTLEEVKKMRLA